MRGYRIHLAAAAVVFVLCATTVRAQNPQEKATQEKATQEKDSQEKGAQPPEQDAQDQSSGKSDAW